MGIGGVVCVLLLTSKCIYAQDAGTHTPLVFEVASIKPSPPSVTGNRSLNYARGGELQTDNSPVKMLIAFAYDLRDWQILNAPAWTGSDGYDIHAKPAPEFVAAAGDGRTPEQQGQLRERTRNLLAERFGLVAHTETREASIYALVVAKNGPKLTPSTAPNRQTSWNAQRVICKHCAMQRLAEVVITDKMGRTCVDHTGLDGEYDFELHFSPDEVGPRPAEDSSAAPSGPSFTTALEEQLGLRLTTIKGQEKFLVVDRVSRPTEN